jgi:hypothetical protein
VSPGWHLAGDQNEKRGQFDKHETPAAQGLRALLAKSCRVGATF